VKRAWLTVTPGVFTEEADLGELNLGDPAVLTDFIDRGIAARGISGRSFGYGSVGPGLVAAHGADGEGSKHKRDGGLLHERAPGMCLFVGNTS